MTLQPQQLNDTIQFSPTNHILILNSAADPFVPIAAQQLTTGAITLAEDNIASLREAERKILPSTKLRHIAFHEYTQKEPPATMDIAIMNLLYQPSKAWMTYGLQVAAYALKPEARLYVVGAKDRGILSIAKQMQEIFGNVETLLISKGQRVVCSRQSRPSIYRGASDAKEDDFGSLTGQNKMEQFARYPPQNREHVDKSLNEGDAAGNTKSQKNVEQFARYPLQIREQGDNAPAAITLLNALYGPSVFAQGKLDEGTRLLIQALEVRPTDEALDIGCGAGYIGLYIARLASNGFVTMIDASLASVALARHNIAESGLRNISVLAGDGAQAVLSQRFDLVVTNPPFHQGGIQTTEIAERFIREASQVLRPGGRFYLVANRFLKYEPTLRAHFKKINEVGGNTRFKVLRASN
jgi:16S rRNA G1207 methylase RsmC